MELEQRLYKQNLIKIYLDTISKKINSESSIIIFGAGKGAENTIKWLKSIDCKGGVY